jgi:hypothetical protein
MDAKTLVLGFFARNASQPLPTSDEAVLLACRYLDAGIIDSLGIVMMITEFEAAFGISFSAEDMQSYEFQTVGGLVEIIERKLVAKR